MFLASVLKQNKRTLQSKAAAIEQMFSLSPYQDELPSKHADRLS